MSERPVYRWLIHHAARRVPEPLAQRLEEEWLADAAERGSAISRLRFAVGCCWATGIIAREHQMTSVVAAVPAYARHHSGLFAGRSGTLVLVASLHAVMLYALVTAVTHIHVGPAGPLLNIPVADRHPDPLPPAIPRPQIDRTLIEAPRPDVDIPADDGPSSQVVARDIVPGEPPLPPIVPRAPTQVPGGPGAGFPNPDDFYPIVARHMEQEGVATVQVCVDAKGRLTSEPKTLQGTGIPSLDEGAVKLAKAGSGHYRATTEDGRPVSSCYPFRVRFQLKN